MSNEALAVLWDEEGGRQYWCIGFFIRDIDQNLIQVIQMDHLTLKNNNNMKE